MTWNEALISDKCIAGTLLDLRRLGELISEKIENHIPGQIIKIAPEYSTHCKSSLVLIIMAEDFIPSSMEF